MIWIILLLILVYYKVIKPINYWKNRGVAHSRPLPILGNYASVAFQRISIFDQARDWYKQFPNERYFGIHKFTTPILMVRDLELIKRITVKDYEYFIDHVSFVSEEIEPLMGKTLANLKGQTWREMRASLTPSFTSSKMKMMFSLMSECAEEFTNYFQKQNTKLVEVEIKDIFIRFASDVIASTAFGIRCNSLEDKNDKFYTMGKLITTFNGLTLLLIQFSKLSKLLKLRMLPKLAVDYFSKVVRETIKKRENEKLFRPDMISLLMEVRKKKNDNNDYQKLTLTDEDIIAQALNFIFGGLETSTTVMTFIAYELALNENIQKRLQQEIDDTLFDCRGKLTYEALQSMKYMDMVVSEALRKWPHGLLIDRTCVKDYIVKPVNLTEKELLIEKGTTIHIPVVGIHRDPKYYPNPDEFDPERFNDENKRNLEPFAYLPFGAGPRACIAQRFALMENKILMFHLLSKFNIVRIDKTLYPMETSTVAFNVVPSNGVWLGISRRIIE